VNFIKAKKRESIESPNTDEFEYKMSRLLSNHQELEMYGKQTPKSERDGFLSERYININDSQDTIDRRSSEYNTPSNYYDYYKDQPYKPELNSLSLEIASRLPSTSKERLLNKPNVPRTYEQYPFKPQLNKKSLVIDSEKNRFETFEERVNEMYKKTTNVQKKIEEKKKEFMEKEMEGCTFSPDVSRSVNKVNIRGRTISDRAAAWEMRRQQKLMRGKIQMEEKKMQNCTFNPNTARIKVSSPKNTIEALGVEEFVSRQKIAREKKNEMEKVFKTGDKWKNQITIPKEFSFGSKDGIKIKSLQKPVTQTLANKKTNYFDSSMDQGKEPSMILHDGALRYDEDENNLVTNISTFDKQEKQFLAPDVPPQGLFSSKTTFSILDCSAGSPSQQSNSENGSSVLQSLINLSISPSKEWMKRSKQKESQHTDAEKSSKRDHELSQSVYH